MTGELVPDYCGANLCPWCGPIIARRTAKAIAMALPRQFATITQVGRSWNDVRACMERIARRLRPLGWCAAWHVEHNGNRENCHVHAWVRSDQPVDPHELWEACRSANAGGSRLADVTHHGNLGYGMKAVPAPYSGRPRSAIEAQLEDFLCINGGRFVHSNRGFWKSPDGEPITYRKALSLTGPHAHHGQ